MNKRASILPAVGSLLMISGCVTHPVQYADGPEASQVFAAIPGNWYAGDLHGQSEYSDGDSPVAAVIAHAENRELTQLLQVCAMCTETKINGICGDGRLDILVKPYHHNSPRLDVLLNGGR